MIFLTRTLTVIRAYKFVKVNFTKIRNSLTYMLSLEASIGFRNDFSGLLFSKNLFSSSSDPHSFSFKVVECPYHLSKAF